MANVTTSALTKVASRDGTELAVWTTGTGPPVLLVHGTTSDHTTWRRLVPYLAADHTVANLDRRGRGESSDGSTYSLDRELEDVAAVVDAISANSGEEVDVVGHSFGGLCAFGAADLTPRIRRLVLYEGWPVPDPDAVAVPRQVMDQLDRLVGKGQPEEALLLFYREVVKMSEEEVAVVRSSPTWSVRVAAAHTISREDEAIRSAVLDPGQAARIRIPVLIMVGEESQASITAGYEDMARALSDARVTTLAGQQHLAHLLDPARFAHVVTDFLRLP
jgi:pimeloyl-ACP methyl ester carboxylesterase